MKVTAIYGYAYREIEILEVNEEPVVPRYPSGFIRFKDDEGKERKMMIKVNSVGKYITVRGWNCYFYYEDGVMKMRRY